MTEIQEAIEEFFLAPDQKVEVPGFVSPLYIIQREVLKCFGENPDSGSPTPFKAILPGTTAIFIGIDLLSQCYFGNLKPKSSTKRVKIFLQNYFRLNPEEQETLYRFRSALTHTFGMYSFDESLKKEFRFKLLMGKETILEKRSASVYDVHALALKNQFFKAIHFYQLHLQKSENMQQKFMKVYRKTGKMQIENDLII
jgi:hypothetical protein